MLNTKWVRAINTLIAIFVSLSLPFSSDMLLLRSLKAYSSIHTSVDYTSILCPVPEVGLW